MSLSDIHELSGRFRHRTGAAPPPGIVLRLALLASTDPDALIASSRTTSTGRVWEILALNAHHITWVRAENASTSEWTLENESLSEEGSVIEAWARPRSDAQAVALLAPEAEMAQESHQDTTFAAGYGFAITFSDSTTITWPSLHASSESDDLLRSLLHGEPAPPREWE